MTKTQTKGTVRREFTWRGVVGDGLGTRWCTVTWVRHGELVAAVAHHHDMLGPGITLTGIAHGAAGGVLFGGCRPNGVESAAILDKPCITAADVVEAIVRLAIFDLEHRSTAGIIEEPRGWKAQIVRAYANRKEARDAKDANLRGRQED